eukprot:GHVS01025184.1.p1 GENE.GHVS01025184.1~~GHVS01025184.1.p1  ORF type:complete len:168 (+),score=8.31 GHVS01025184.1:43-504(+)
MAQPLSNAPLLSSNAVSVESQSRPFVARLVLMYRNVAIGYFCLGFFGLPFVWLLTYCMFNRTAYPILPHPPTHTEPRVVPGTCHSYWTLQDRTVEAVKGQDLANVKLTHRVADWALVGFVVAMTAIAVWFVVCIVTRPSFAALSCPPPFHGAV